MPTRTSRTTEIGHDLGPVEAFHSLLRYGDRPNEAYAPATANEHATLMAVESFSTARTWAPALRNHTGQGVEIVVRVVTAPGGGETLTAILDHYRLENDSFVPAEVLGTIGDAGDFLYQSVLSLPGLWRLRLLPSDSGTWEAGGSYSYLQAPGPGYPVGRFYTGDERGPLALAVYKPFGPEALVPEPDGLTPLQVDGDGALFVTVSGTVATSGSGQARPLIFHYDPAFDPFPVLGDTEYQQAATPNGAAHINLRNDDGDEIGIGGEPLVIAGAVTLGAALPAGANTIGAVDVLSLPELPAGDQNIGNVDVLSLPAGTVAGGSSLPAGSNNIGDVDVLTLPSLPAGSNNIGDVDVLTLPSLPAGTNNIGDVDVLTLPAVAGTIAHDDADSGNPLKIGFKALAHGANPAAVAVGDRTDGYANRHGIPWVIGGHPHVITHRVNYTAAQTDAAIITVSSGTKIVVTQVMATADKANTVDVAVRIGFGASNTPTGAGVLAAHPGIEAGGGFVRGDGSGILGVGADGEDVRITSEVPTTGSIDVTLSYYTIES
jgi:hypothetical protein